MQVDIPDELAARIRRLADEGDGYIYGRQFLHDLAALLPEPNPLDVLAQKEGWERGGRDCVVFVTPDCRVSVDTSCERSVSDVRALALDFADPASACALAERIVEAIREAQ